MTDPALDAQAVALRARARRIGEQMSADDVTVLRAIRLLAGPHGLTTRDELAQAAGPEALALADAMDHPRLCGAPQADRFRGPRIGLTPIGARVLDVLDTPAPDPTEP